MHFSKSSMCCRFYRARDHQIINVQNDADLNAISTSTDHTEDAIIIWVEYETIQLQFTSIRPLYQKLAAFTVPNSVLSNCTIIVPSKVRNSAHSRTILMKIDDSSLSRRICRCHVCVHECIPNTYGDCRPAFSRS